MLTRKGQVMACNNARCQNDANYICGKCRREMPALAEIVDERRRAVKRNGGQSRNRRNSGGGTSSSTAFRDKPQRNDPSVTNTYFNSGTVDGSNHGHVKYRNNPDGTTDYLYARDVEGNEYDF